ncbi:toxin VasX [Xenorhabdus bovienii]|uniref:toxin VasX n=1 Tax=Xenorhabdus bovienii TaxID=40576 RepID=UPI003DA61CE2
MTTSMQDLTTNADHSLSRLEMGSPLSPCDSNIKPLYPVRYAYVNFFGENLVKPEAPPDIHTLMSATSLEESKGYAARLMRPGWIYIKEEGDMKHRPSGTSYFHIFKYDVPKDSGNNGESPRIERFRKFIYRNRKNARDGVEPEPGLRGEGYPFLFVSKDVSKISIAYSEHLWHPDVIARMDSDETLRQKTMQFINLDDDKQTHAIEATEANFTRLIQDYKIRKEQFATAKAKIDAKNFEELDLESIRIDEPTTQLSYEMDAENIAKEIRSKLCYQEKARIVILHDPVGRQKEILEAHDILTEWQQHNAKLNAYPLTIGMYVDSLVKSRMSAAQYLKVAGSVNQRNAHKYWPLIRDEYLEFEKRQETFSKLFKAFASEKAVTAQVGSLDNYFKYFFSVHNDKKIIQESDFQEIDTFIDLISDIFDGLQHSIPSEKMLEELISQSVENSEMQEAQRTSSDAPQSPESKINTSISTASDIHEFQYSSNTWEIAATGVVKIVTHSYTGEAKSRLSVVMKRVSDRFLNVFGRILGKAVALMETGVTKARDLLTHLSHSAIQFISQKIVPALLKPFGFVIDYRQGIPLSRQEFEYILKRLEIEATKVQHTSGKKRPKMPKFNPIFKKLRYSESLFRAQQQKILPVSDAEQKLENSTKKVGNSIKSVASQASINIKLGLIVSLDDSLNFLKVGTKKTSILLEKTVPGVSLFLNIKTASSVVIQSKFNQNNPLDQHKYSAAYDSIKFSTALVLLTADILSVTSTVTEYAPKLLPKSSPALLYKLDKISNKTAALGNKIAVKTAIGLVSIIGAFISFIDGQKAGAVGNIGAQYSHYAMALGGVALGITNIFGVASTLLLTLNVIGWLFIIGGTIGLMLFNRSDMENLIYNCFWGKGNMYPFWRKGKRPDMNVQLKRAREMNDKTWHAFNIEQQEFLNTLFMPQLNINRTLMKNNKYNNKYTFTLPGFQEGSSDLHYAFYKPLPKPINNWSAGRYAPVEVIQQNMNSLEQEKIYYEALKEKAEDIDGKLYLYDEEMTITFRKAFQATSSSEDKNGSRHLTITFEDKYSYPYEENAKLFWHYIPFQDTVIPLRYLAGQSLQETAILGFKGEEIR